MSFFVSCDWNNVILCGFIIVWIGIVGFRFDVGYVIIVDWCCVFLDGEIG